MDMLKAQLVEEELEKVGNCDDKDMAEGDVKEEEGSASGDSLGEKVNLPRPPPKGQSADDGMRQTCSGT